MAVSPNNVTVNVGALSNALAVAIQQATSNSSSSTSFCCEASRYPSKEFPVSLYLKSTIN